MHADGNRESSCNGCDDGGYRRRKRKLAALTILKWQCVVIWMPSQIFERSEEGASSRKGACPFAFARQSLDDFARRLCSGASECARKEVLRIAILRA